MKQKRLVKIVKDSYGTLYGIDKMDTFWRLDKLDGRGVTYKVVTTWR